MTHVSTVRAALVSLTLVAIAAASFAVQYVSAFISKGLADGASMRVAAADTCSEDGTHFTGCSSIL